jgi:hypothetical protein
MSQNGKIYFNATARKQPCYSRIRAWSNATRLANRACAARRLPPAAGHCRPGWWMIKTPGRPQGWSWGLLACRAGETPPRICPRFYADPLRSTPLYASVSRQIRIALGYRGRGHCIGTLGLGPPKLVGGNVEGAGGVLGGAADWHPDLEAANSTAGQKSVATAIASAGEVPLRTGKEEGDQPTGQ